jgi:hypothetical protein
VLFCITANLLQVETEELKRICEKDWRVVAKEEENCITAEDSDPCVDLMKFIDDYDVVEEVEEVQGELVVRAVKTELMLEKIVRNSEVLGMKVNGSKTQLIAISTGSKSIRATIKSGTEEIESGDSLTLLGFVFGPKPDASLYVKNLVQKFHSKIWVVRNLMKAGWNKHDVCKLYKTVVLSTLEYLSPVYHSLLSVAQEKQLENMQKKSLKMIFGWDLQYEDLLVAAGLESLKTRREKRVVRFARKCEKNERFFKLWLEPNVTEVNTRHPNKYKEAKAKTMREDRNPVNYLTKVLNREHRQTGKIKK